jgi:hypothetical protein
MAESYLAMLDMGLQHTEQAFSRIDESISKSFQLAEEARQFESTLAQRGVEFAAQMAANDRALLVEDQKNRMIAENYRAQNQLDVKKFEAEMELRPQALELQKLQIEAAKENKKRILMADKEKAFGIIAAPTDTIIAGEIASSNNSALGESYLKLRQKYAGISGAGIPFDEQRFAAEAQELIDTHRQMELNNQYDPKVPIILDRLGATSEATRLRNSNPSFQGNVEGIRSGIIMGTPHSLAEIAASPIGSRLGDVNNLALAQSNYNGYKRSIDSRRDEIQKLYSERSANKDNPDRIKEIDKQISEKHASITELESRQNAILQKGMRGESVSEIPSDPNQVDIEAAKKKQEQLATVNKQVEEGTKIAPTPVSPFDPNYEKNKTESNIGAYTSQFPEAFKAIKGRPEGTVDFKGWNGQKVRNSPEHIKSLRNVIIDNLGEIPLDANEQKEFPNSKTNIYELIEKDSFKKALERLSGNAIGISGIQVKNKNTNLPLNTGIGSGLGYFPPNNYDSTVTSIGKRNSAQSFFSGGITIESPEDFIRIIKESDGTPDERRQLAQTLYATVVAAGAVDQWK